MAAGSATCSSGTSFAVGRALDQAFAARRGGRPELVLDLRYNGGGLVDVAYTWRSLIVGM